MDCSLSVRVGSPAYVLDSRVPKHPVAVPAERERRRVAERLPGSVAKGLIHPASRSRTNCGAFEMELAGLEPATS